MAHVFNLGLGMLVVLPAEQVTAALASLATSGTDAWLVGAIAARGAGPAVLLHD